MWASARWGSLVLAVSALVAWAVVSGLRLAHQGPSLAEMAAHGEPRRISDLTFTAVGPPAGLATLRRADVALRLAAALLVAAHLVILNRDGRRQGGQASGRERRRGGGT